MWVKGYIVYVTWALVIHLICTPSALWIQGVYIRQIHVTFSICNTFAPKIKGMFEDNIFDVTLVRGQHHDVDLTL